MHTRSHSSKSIPPHSPGVSPRFSHRVTSSWSGPLSNLLRRTPSPNPDQNTFVFPPRPSTPIKSRSYKEYHTSEPLQSPNKTTDRARVRSRSCTMPLSQHPYPLGSYQPSSYDPYPQPEYQYASLVSHRKHRYTASASSIHGQYTPNTSQDSTFVSHPSAYSSHKQPSSRLLHVSPQRNRRSYSASMSLPSPHRIYENQWAESFTTGPPFLDSFSSPQGRGRTRAKSLSQSYPVRTKKSSSRLRKSRSRTRSLLPPVEQAFKDYSRRVRFILPATIHPYLHDPPFRMSVKRSVSSDLAKYYQYHFSQPATEPTVSFLLITTPHLPWKIRLGAIPVSAFPSSSYHHAPLAYLTVHEVLNGIYLALREYITIPEYESLRLNRSFRDQVITAYRKRISQEKQDIPGDQQEPMRRVDWLVGRTVFQGLEESTEGEGVWQLRLGWREGV